MAIALWTASLALLSGCSGGATGPQTETAAEAAVKLPFDVQGTWAVGAADAATWQQFQSEGWLAYIEHRDLRKSAGALGTDAGRAHAEAALMFRQAALVSANSAIQTYDETPEATDPVGAAHLVSVGWAMRGDIEKARAASARLDGVEDVTGPWHAPWKAWLASDGAWPPDLAGLPIQLPAPAAGQWPVLADLPHYRMPVRGAGDFAQDMGDPGALLALSLWHEQAARQAMGDDSGLATWMSRYRLPVEPALGDDATVAQALVFASDFLAPVDVAFMAAVTGDQGLDAVETFADRSPLAALTREARASGEVDAERVVDLAVAAREAIVDASSAKTGDEIQAHHRMFADMAHVGILRNLALVAEVEGNREEGGKLRILAMEAAHGSTQDVVASMALAAWDTGNRQPIRAQEIVHRGARFYPSLEVTRYALDALALRVGREQSGTPGM